MLQDVKDVALYDWCAIEVLMESLQVKECKGLLHGKEDLIKFD